MIASIAIWRVPCAVITMMGVSGRELAAARDRVEAVHVGQPDVEQDQVVGGRLELVEQGARGGRDLGLVAAGGVRASRRTNARSSSSSAMTMRSLMTRGPGEAQNIRRAPSCGSKLRPSQSGTGSPVSKPHVLLGSVR